MTSYLACLGTRPEIIKMAPLYRVLRARGHQVQVLHTGQHTDMADALYAFFAMPPDAQVRLQRQTPRLSHLTAELLTQVDEQMQQLAPDVVLVQGDTSTALAGALAAYYQDVPVAHVEAGLRTGERDPFPEEMNRCLIGRLAQWHFPPTPQATQNLLHEGIDGSRVHQVGNTVIDAALWAREHLRQQPLHECMPPDLARFMQLQAQGPMLLVTAHRRENWGVPMQRIAAAIGGLLQLHPQLSVVWPLHPNPKVRADVHMGLASVPAQARARLCLSDALQYPALIGVLERCSFTLTDSGGIQEEASALQKPVLILRESTERQELVQAGGAQLVGTLVHQIIEHASELLHDPVLLTSMQLQTSPFGDGLAAQRIADVLCREVHPTLHVERLAA